MALPPDDLAAARRLTADAAEVVARAPSFQALDADRRAALLRDLDVIESGLNPPQPADPYAFALETPNQLRRRRLGGADDRSAAVPEPAVAPAAGAPAARPKPAATETLAARAGALSDEIDFPAFVAGLVHGTFGAIVDASIRQMEEFANLVSAVAKDVDQFTRENVTVNQVRDELVSRYPGDLALDVPLGVDGGEPRLRARRPDDDESPSWLADYGLSGRPLNDELVEQQLVPAARRSVGERRLQMLATLVLLGMNRVNVRDGRISARVRFRAAARDNAMVEYAASQDPGSGTASLGARGSERYANHATMISTVGVNAQSDTELRAELFGEVEINFVSETLPLDRFADASRMALLQRNSQVGGPPTAGTPTAALQPAHVAPLVPAPAPPAPASAPPATLPAPAVVIPAPAPAPEPEATP